MRRVAGVAALVSALCRAAVLGLLAGTSGRTAGSTAEQVLDALAWALLGLAVVGLAVGTGGPSREQAGRALVVLVGAAVTVGLLLLATPELVGHRGPFWLYDDLGRLAVGGATLGLAGCLLSPARETISA